MSTNSKPSSDYPSLNGKTGWLQRIAEYLLSLPRSVKRAILLTTDLVASLVCLFLALSLRYGDIAHNISLAILISYATLPIVGLYLNLSTRPALKIWTLCLEARILVIQHRYWLMVDLII